MKCNQCIKKDVCKNYIHNCDKACSHFLGIKGVWELMSKGMNDSVYITDKFVNMYGEDEIFNTEPTVL